MSNPTPHTPENHNGSRPSTLRRLAAAFAAVLLLAAAGRAADAPAAKPIAAQPAPGTATALHATDGLGREVALAGPARRVISLYAAFNETLLAMDLGDRIVARTKADGEEPRLADLPAVGTHLRPNVELTLAMRPDLVLQLGGRSTALAPVERIEQAGVPVAVFNPVSLEDYFALVRTLGELLGAAEQARDLEAGLRARLARVAHVLAHDPRAAARPTVFFEVRSPDLLAAGAKSIVNDVIRLAGGANCVKTSKKLVKLGDETLIGLDPEVYIVQRGPMNPAPAPLDRRPLLAPLAAVQNGRWLEVDEAEFSRPGPRVVDAVEKLARRLHPEADWGPETSGAPTSDAPTPPAQQEM
jgi:iron complex transport system substrate-binding protein